MTREQWDQRLREIVSDVLAAPPHSIQPDTRLVEDLAMDSLAGLEILQHAEEFANTRFPLHYVPANAATFQAFADALWAFVNAPDDLAAPR